MACHGSALKLFRLDYIWAVGGKNDFGRILSRGKPVKDGMVA